MKNKIEEEGIQPKKPLGLKKLTQTPQGRSFTWISLSFFTVAFFVAIAIRPTIITVAKLTKDIKENQTANTQLDEKINSLVEAQKIYAGNSHRITLLNDAFPERSEFPTLAYFLENAAQASLVKLNSLSFEKIDLSLKPSEDKKIKANQPYLTINFSLSSEGEYSNLKNFIETLENSRRLISIESSAIHQSKKKNAEETVPTLTLALSGKAFFKKE